MRIIIRKLWLMGCIITLVPGLSYGADQEGLFHLIHRSRLNSLAILIGLVVILLYLISESKKGRKFFLRRIAGLDAVDEAIGRATEMGKPLLFVNGQGDPSNIATVAAINILGLIARRTAEYETPLKVPNVDPVTFAVEKEVVKEAYMRAGKPDAYNPDDVFYIAGTQFAYTAAVSGLMVREKPATIFYLGRFYAESLILAETGATTGAIQIAGTEAVTQLPFFVAACDYTLIGEELFAASAYLSHEPLLIGALKAQDYGKLLAGITLVLGVIYTIIVGNDWFVRLLRTS
ncbi:MAG: DUF6754 domain-containing protein [bacterium]